MQEAGGPGVQEREEYSSKQTPNDTDLTRPSSGKNWIWEQKKNNFKVEKKKNYPFQ